MRIYLPVGYESNTTTYPIIYALESDTWFGTMTSILDELGTKVIVVAPAGSALYDQILSRNYQGLKAQKKEYPQNHGGMFIPSFTDAMLFLFP